MSRVETATAKNRVKDRPGRFIMALGAFSLLGIASLWQGNKIFAPAMYTREGSVEIAKAFAAGKNYAVFDLNINIRELRDEHLKRMTTTPDVVVLGASHWQEAHDWLIGHKIFYNAHIHRDYYEDMLGMVEMLERHDRLPKQLIIAIRDNLFTPVKDRRDHLWLPGVPYYEAMAKRLGIAPHPWTETAPYPRWRELASLPMFYANVSRYANATFRPRLTYEAEHAKLDTLLPGGSIVWSHEHQAVFTAKRAREMSDDFARQRLNDPPKIDPKGVAHIDRLLQHLKNKGVEVFLAHPPFNPDYYNQVMSGPYAKGLRRVEELTRNFADKYGWQVIGGFDPAKVGCEARMFIDAEHGSPECLAKLLNEYTMHDNVRSRAAPPEPLVVSDATTVGQSVRHRIAVAIAEPTAKLHDETLGAVMDKKTQVAEVQPLPPEPAAALAPQAPTIVIKPLVTRPSPPLSSLPPATAAVGSQVNSKIAPAKPKTAATHPRSTVPAASAPIARSVEPLVELAPVKPAVVTNRTVQKKHVAKTVRYPIVTRTGIADAGAQICAPYVWPGDHAYPERLKAVCGYRGGKVRGL